MGLLITVMVCAASVQDRDGAKSVLLGTYLSTSRCRLVFVGRLVEWAARVLGVTVDIVSKPEGHKGFSVLPRW
jgi:hypothetical protein